MPSAYTEQREVGRKELEKQTSHAECSPRAGPLPKVMPVSLEILNLSGDVSIGGTPHKFTGGLPAEWGSSLQNLKELRMVKCGLDGECLVYVQADTESR